MCNFERSHPCYFEGIQFSQNYKNNNIKIKKTKKYFFLIKHTILTILLFYEKNKSCFFYDN